MKLIRITRKVGDKKYKFIILVPKDYGKLLGIKTSGVNTFKGIQRTVFYNLTLEFEQVVVKYKDFEIDSKLDTIGIDLATEEGMMYGH